jgi:hypothetical protein
MRLRTGLQVKRRRARHAQQPFWFTPVAVI